MMHLQAIILVCISLATYTTQTITFTVEGGFFQKLNTDVSGSCDTDGGTESNTELAGTNYTFDCRKTPSDSVTPLASYGAEITRNGDVISFSKLQSDTVKVLNLWCGAPISASQNCDPIIFYELAASNTSDGYDCQLKFASDRVGSDSFKRPSEVSWKVNGNDLDPPVMKTLAPSDFTDEDEGIIKVLNFPLNLGADEKVGKYSCEFTVQGSDEPIKAEVGEDAAPVAVAWSTDPDKEQFKDHDDVKISCSFVGSPLPTITWKFNGEAYDGVANVTTKVNKVISTISLIDIEDSTDRGNYSCHALNSKGEAMISGRLHVRDTLAPLWPFIGIVVQVIVLAICIYVGERIRKKKHAEKQRRRQLQTEGIDGADQTTRT